MTPSSRVFPSQDGMNWLKIHLSAPAHTEVGFRSVPRSREHAAIWPLDQSTALLQGNFIAF